MAGKQSNHVTSALELVVRRGITPYRAAKESGIALSTIYRALAKLPRTHPARQEQRRQRREAMGL